MGKYIDTSVFNKGGNIWKNPLNFVYLYAYQSNTCLGNKLYAIYLCTFWLFVAINGYNIGNNVSNNSGGFFKWAPNGGLNYE